MNYFCWRECSLSVACVRGGRIHLGVRNDVMEVLSMTRAVVSAVVNDDLVIRSLQKHAHQRLETCT